jgi:hypothetical protein
VQPYPRHPHPSNPHQGAPYPDWRRKPSAGTAVAAAVLALAIGPWFLASIFEAGFAPLATLVVAQFIDAVVGLTLLLGGILLLTRKSAGQVLILTGTVMALLTAIFYAHPLTPFYLGTWLIRRIAIALPLVSLLVLALLPSTRRYTRRPVPSGYGYQPYPPHQQGGRPPDW